MRHARLKPDYMDTYRHCYNRVAGDRHYRPFGDAEKEHFIKLLRRTRPCRRRGSLWASRFKNVVLESGLAVWDCWKYIPSDRVHHAGHAADAVLGRRIGDRLGSVRQTDHDSRSRSRMRQETAPETRG